MKPMTLKAGMLALVLLAIGSAVEASSSYAQTSSAPAHVAPDTLEKPRELTARQKALAAEADRLVAMAAELKEQVDKTNKNILSMRVVLKAEEIELFAHRVKQEKR